MRFASSFLHTHQRITLRIVAGVGGDAEYTLICRFHAVGHLHHGGIVLGGSSGQGERLLGQVAEVVVFVERRSGAFRAGTGVLILLRELTLGVVFAAGVDEAAECVRGESVHMLDLHAIDVSALHHKTSKETVLESSSISINFFVPHNIFEDSSSS